MPTKTPKIPLAIRIDITEEAIGNVQAAKLYMRSKRFKEVKFLLTEAEGYLMQARRLLVHFDEAK